MPCDDHVKLHDETLIQSNIHHFNYDHVRNEAKDLYIEALSLLPVPQLKIAV